MSGFSKEWDQIYDKSLQLNSWPWSDLVSLVFVNCKDIIMRRGSVFELGCGSGPNIRFFESLGVDFYGVEGSEVVVQNLYKKYPELKNKITVGDFSNANCFMNVPDIDIIIDRAAVTHNDLPAIKRTILNSFDKLKVGGYFIGIDWFSTKHSDFQLGVQGGDRYTRTNIKEGQFKGVGNVHFSDEEHMRSLFLGFDIISLEEKIINNYELQNNHQLASWNIVARKR